ncbi:retrovirus-related Pol polyprotein from type-1 retrotransposable element R2 [Trichonephila clavipes]|nr:retrovirus-related Pol polyprotein from type-1 retrotransposable element R2 [Trichonephila clavipes]
MVGEYSDTTNQYSNHWTLARKASSRQSVSWSFVDGSPSVTIGADVLSPTKRRSVMRTFHDNFQLVETQNLLAAPSQGKVMDCVAMSPASSHLITDGKYTRFADWRFVHKARLNLIPLNACRKGPQPALRACRKCGEWDETLPHVINHCKSYSAAWQLRHNAVLARIRAAVAFKGTILSENQVAGPNRLRPDLVANVDNKIYIIDVTIPFENRRGAFSQARERKISKYLELIPYFTSLGYRHVQIVPIIVGALGAWDPENDAFLRKVATKRYLAVLRKLCVSDCIRWSRDIYTQHLTGAQQYSTDTSLHPPPQCTQERRQPRRKPPNVGNSTVPSEPPQGMSPPDTEPQPRRTNGNRSNSPLPPITPLASHSNVIESPHAGIENNNVLLAEASVPVVSPLATDNVDGPTNVIEALDSSPPVNSSANELEGQFDMDYRDIASPGLTMNDGEQSPQSLNAPSVVEG